jgi:hypothetical protein
MPLAFLVPTVESRDDAIISKTSKARFFRWNAGAERIFRIFAGRGYRAWPITR